MIDKLAEKTRDSNARPDLGKLLEASWQQNEVGYRYLATTNRD